MSNIKDIFTAFLPCRSGSERVKEKNTRAFSSYEYGLFELKLEQLLKVSHLNKIIVSTDDQVIKDLIKKRYVGEKVEIDNRPEELCQSTTSTDSLINYLPKIISAGNVLWTHVTSPFFDETQYCKAIQAYKDSDCDSLMSVTEIKKFLWNEGGPINYDPKDLKWPRTQDLKPVYEVNSAVFIADIETYKSNNDRVGRNPCLHVVDEMIGMDIDIEQDFSYAQLVWDKLYVKS